MRKALPLLLAITLMLNTLLAGCGSGDTSEITTTTSIDSGAVEQTAAAEVIEDTTVIDSFDFTISDRDRDASYNEETATTIIFKEANQIETITEEGTYIVSGTSEGGQLVIDLTNAADAENAKVQVVLDDLHLTNTQAPALLVAQADKVFLTLATGSSNSLSDGSGRTDVAATGTESVDADDTNRNATLYAHDDLTINGSGSLTVTSANHHGIKGQDDVVITGGNLTVVAGVDGIRGKDSVKIAGGTINVQAGDDGIVSTQTSYPYEKGFVSITGGTVVVNAADDGVKGEALVRLAGGSVQVQSSFEGLEGCLVWLEGGLHHITSSDDGINASGDIRTDYLLNILGGTTYVDAEGDGIDSNDTITQSGGTVIVAGATIVFDEGAVDAERVAQATGGVMLAVDSAGMSMGYGSESTQGSLLYTLSSVEQAGTRISLVDSSGAVVFSFVAPKQFYNVAFSSPALVTGESYSFVLGGEVQGGTATTEQQAAAEAFGFDYTEGGTLSGGEVVTSFVLSEMVAQISANGSVQAYSGMGMMGGMGDPGMMGNGGGGPGW